jgi:hypothetical protein
MVVIPAKAGIQDVNNKSRPSGGFLLWKQDYSVQRDLGSNLDIINLA